MTDPDTPTTILGPDGLDRQVCISRNSGDVFAEDVEFDGLTLTVEIADEAEGRAFLAAISALPPVHDLTRAEIDVIAERRRQVTEEGWTADHDDAHDPLDLPFAAASYALTAGGAPEESVYDRFWPWPPKWWKPHPRRRALVKAAALLIAAIEKLDRAESRTKETRDA